MILNRRQFLALATIGLVGASDRDLIASSIMSQRGLKQGGHLTLGTRHDAIGLDSHRFPRGRTHSPIAAIYSGLTDLDRMGDILPSMAEWYEPGQNLMTWTFRLRRGALFHNGREVDAHSVKQNILRLKTTTVGTAWRGGVSHIESVDIGDKYTVHFNLNVPNAALPAGVMHGLQAPETFHQAKDHPIGTGPFKLVSWKRHDETRLARFENYWETDAEGTVLPYLEAITGQYKPEPESRYAALRSGAVDMVDDLTPTQSTSLKQASGNPADANPFQLWRVRCTRHRPGGFASSCLLRPRRYPESALPTR